MYRTELKRLFQRFFALAVLVGCLAWSLPAPRAHADECGWGRTPCEQDCFAAKQVCLNNGGTLADCRDEYQACMSACCP